MLRYRCWPCLGALFLLGACAVPSAHENAAVASRLLHAKVPAPLIWRRDPAADQQARERAEELLADGLTLRDAIAVSFLTSPTLQLAFEQLEISRAELVAATRPTNPYVILGSREPGGDLAAFYPERTISVGVLQNVMSLLTIPDRRATATHNLHRVRHEVAQRAAEHAAQVAESWYRYAAALEQVQLHAQTTTALSTAVDVVAAMVANEEADDADVDAARLAVFSADAAAERAQLEAADERAQLEALLGIAGWRDDWTLAGELPPPPDADPDAAQVEAAALTRRFDLIAAGENIAMRLRELSTQRRFRWITELEIGMFRDKAIGDTPFIGPTLAFEVPVFDQRQAALLEADARLRSATRELEAAVVEARQQIRRHAQAMAAMRRQLQRYERDILPHHQRLAIDDDPDELASLNAQLLMLEAQREQRLLLRDYWVARSALAQAAGDWLALSGAP